MAVRALEKMMFWPELRKARDVGLEGFVVPTDFVFLVVEILEGCEFGGSVINGECCVP
jgi:hypothetical protein